MIAVALTFVGFSGNIVGVLGAAAVFSLGAIMARPGQETVIANLADPGVWGTYFGSGGLTLAIGGSLGPLIGGIAYDYGKQHDLQLATWLPFFAIGSATAVLLWINRQRFNHVRDGAPAAPAAPLPTSVPARTAG